MNKPFDMKEIISNYINFIESITQPDLYNVIVIYPYVSPIKKDEYVLMQLYRYHILDNFLYKEDTIYILDSILYNNDNKGYILMKNIYRKLKPFFQENKRTNRLFKFNNILSKCIEKTSIIPINMNKYLLDSNKKIKHKYIAPNPWNIHFKWEPQIPNYIKEFSPYGLSMKYLLSKSKLKKEEEKYIQEKQKQIDIFLPKFKKLLYYLIHNYSSIRRSK